MIFLNYYEFINEQKKFSLTFRVDDFGKVDIDGRVFTIKELFSNYGHIIDYAFATYLDKKLMYFPSQKKFKIVKSKIPHENGKYFDISTERVKWRSVKVMPDFITGMQLDNIMRNTKNAAYYRYKKTYIEILDWEDNIIDTYHIDKKTGELI